MGKKCSHHFPQTVNGRPAGQAVEFDPQVVQRIVGYLLPEDESHPDAISAGNRDALHRAIQYISCLFRGDQLRIGAKGISEKYADQLGSTTETSDPLYGRILKGAAFHIKHDANPLMTMEFNLYENVMHMRLAFDADHYESDARTFFIRLKDNGILHHPGEKSVSHMCSVCGDIVRFLQGRQSTTIAPLVDQNWQNMKSVLFDSAGKRSSRQPCQHNPSPANK